MPEHHQPMKRILLLAIAALPLTLTSCANHRASAIPNTLTAQEKAAGWELLFDGQDLNGWSNFKTNTVRSGWQVKDGALACVDPHNAGDLVTAGKYDWFELQLDYSISEGGNSGIIYHITEKGGAVWATGPEFQLEDNTKAADPVRCG
ncbi:MAG: yliI, partial [Pedosphaera sp.]|nr:yliI [Pedosphaera sp.]